MTTLYVDNIAPNLNSTISAPNLAYNLASGDMPTGSVLQVQQNGTTNAGLSTTSASSVATGVKVTITPSAASSKILITCSSTLQNGTGGGGTNLSLNRKIGSGSMSALYFHGSAGLIQYDAGNNNISAGVLTYLDSPNTTSAVEYEIFYSRYYTGTSYLLSGARIIAMEIAG